MANLAEEAVRTFKTAWFAIEDDELAEFRQLVKAYAGLTTHQMNQLLRDKNWTEICDGDQT